MVHRWIMWMYEYGYTDNPDELENMAEDEIAFMARDILDGYDEWDVEPDDIPADMVQWARDIMS